MTLSIIVLAVLAVVFVTGFILLIHDERAICDAAGGRKNTELLERIYMRIWSGDPADRKTAWFRVIGYLQRENYPEEMIREAQLRGYYEDKHRETVHYSVNCAGRIVKSTRRTYEDN